MPIRLEQQAQATVGAGAVASVNFTLPAAPTNGNLLVCVWEHNDTNPVMSGTGVTWTRQSLFIGDASHDNTALFTGVVGPGASATQTLTLGTTANAAGILLEFSGVQQAVDGTPPTPTNLSSATPSITSNAPAFPADLVIAFMGNVGNNVPTATPSGWQAITGATNTRRLDGAYNITSALAASTAQWSYSGSQFALAEIVLIKARLGGTSTSTSSTSISSTSTSSTSQSVSSTSSSTSISSTSISSSSISTSSTSTSISTSSTSSSISSTSISTSSTSTSSTSSSTSVSSTSTSISSTSISSTSTSSTSSSTSISSTSTSFSSTSSSQSSTSASTSSTSVSSTSSSSSTSTTAIPQNLDYTYQDTLTLPSTVTDDIDLDIDKNYQNEAVDDADYFIQYGSEYMIQEFKKTWTNNTDTPSFTYKGRTTYDTRVSPLLIQIYNTAKNVTFDANAVTVADSSAVTTLDQTTLTVGSGNDRALIAQLAFGDAVPSNVTVSWDATGTPQKMTLLKSAIDTGNHNTVQLWGLLNPTAGNKTLRASWTTAAELTMNATSFTNVNQRSDDAFAHLTSATGSGNNPSIAITSATHNLTMDLNAGFAGLESAPTQTQIYIKSGIGALNSAASRAAGAASNTHAWTLDSSVLWASVGVDIVASSWETLAVINKVPADVDFSVTFTQTTNVSNYYDSNNTVTFRVYQQVV